MARLKKSGVPGAKKISSVSAGDKTVFSSGDKNDGYIAITFRENNLQVYADFMPPIGEGAPLTVDFAADVFSGLNIVHGIKWDLLRNVILKCNLEKRPEKNVLIAQGDFPVQEVHAYFEMNPHLLSPPVPVGKNGRIDYHAYSPFVIVKKDQALARLHPQKAGQEGKTVQGQPIPSGFLRPEGVVGGENTRTDNQYILSNINGQLIETKGILTVQGFLEIKGPVGYSTGHIIFPGDVIIEGPVSDGFKIHSGGSLTIKQTFDVTDASSRGDMNILGGIIGRGKALVKAGGAIRTKFIENCRVAARKNITVDSEIINSSVYTMESLEMGDKGLIVGGEIYAVHGVRVGRIGRKVGKAANIHCGIDFTADQEKEKNNNILKDVAIKLGRLRELLEDKNLDAEKRAKMEELRRRLEEEQRRAGARVTELLARIIADQNAAVEVTGEIAPGTLIEICQVALIVSEPLKRVRLRLDMGKVINEPLA